MKVAVVGAGTMGGMHAALLGTMDDVDGLYVVDADGARADDVARRNGGTACTFEEALEAAEAIIVATPAEMHAAAVGPAVEAGLHVLCEKPLTDAIDTSIALTRQVEAAGAHVEVGFQRRHDAAFVAARGAVDGRIHLVKLTAHDPLVTRRPSLGPPPQIAPIFLHSSVHDFDLVRWLSGQEVAEVQVFAGRRDGRIPTDPREIECAVVTMRLSGGGLAVLDASWLQPMGYDIRVELLTEGTAASAGRSARTPVRDVDSSTPLDPWDGYLQRFEPAYRAELSAFLAACRASRPPTSTARDGLESLRIAAAATRSFAEGRCVALDEIPGSAPAMVV